MSDNPSLDMDGALVIYTDGACSGNPGPGGWGVVMFHGAKQKELKGGERATTNNRMEMQAVIEALRAIKPGFGGKTILFSDSTYVLKGLQEWLPGWKRRGWKTAAKKPVKNVDLWQELDALACERTIDWRWIKGHSGDFGNERADALAREGIPSGGRGGSRRKTTTPDRNHTQNQTLGTKTGRARRKSAVGPSDTT